MAKIFHEYGFPSLYFTFSERFIILVVSVLSRSLYLAVRTVVFQQDIQKSWLRLLICIMNASSNIFYL